MKFKLQSKGKRKYITIMEKMDCNSVQIV